MIKGIGTIALALSMNTADVSASTYKDLLSKDNLQSTQSINTEQDFSVTPEQKEYFRNLNKKNIESTKQYQAQNEAVFRQNFNRWVVEDSESVKILVDDILKMAKDLSMDFKQEAKYYKKHQSLAKLLIENANIWDDIYRFTVSFKTRADQANQANYFISKFIPDNQEVLTALA